MRQVICQKKDCCTLQCGGNRWPPETEAGPQANQRRQDQVLALNSAEGQNPQQPAIRKLAPSMKEIENRSLGKRARS